MLRKDAATPVLLQEVHASTLTSRVVLQIWLANLMPSAAFLPLTALMASAAVVNGCKFCNMLNSSSGQGLWRNWQDFLGVLGIAMLPQVL